MTAKPILTNPDDIDRRVAHQFEDALRRAIAAGAKPPLTYMGAGMTGIVFCTRHEAFKVSRETRPLDRSFFTDEAEWLKAARRVKGVREHVARIRSFDAKHLVIRRECPQSDVPRWKYPDLWDLHQRIRKLMIPHGWTAPEYKDDSYVVTMRRGRIVPVLVDASMPSRIGMVLLKHVKGLLRDRSKWDIAHETPSMLAYQIRTELGERLLTPKEAMPTLNKLYAMGASRG